MTREIVRSSRVDQHRISSRGAGRVQRGGAKSLGEQMDCTRACARRLTVSTINDCQHNVAQELLEGAEKVGVSAMCVTSSYSKVSRGISCPLLFRTYHKRPAAGIGGRYIS